MYLNCICSKYHSVVLLALFVLNIVRYLLTVLSDMHNRSAILAGVDPCTKSSQTTQHLREYGLGILLEEAYQFLAVGRQALW